MDYSAKLQEYFGYLPQLGTFEGFACTPTSATNALTYIVSKPGFAGGEYAPLLNYSGWESVRDDIAKKYFYTSSKSIPPGTFPALAVIGMDQYLEDHHLRDHVSISAIGVSTDGGINIAGWDRLEGNGFPAIGPASDYSQLFTEQRVTGEFLRASLLRSDAILAGGFYQNNDKGPQGHAVLITDLNWTDKNANGLIDAQDGATVSILDPLDPSQTYSPDIGTEIGYGNGSTRNDQLVDALNTKVTATGEALFKKGRIFQNEAGELVVKYEQSSLSNEDGIFRNSTGDSSNGITKATDMTLKLTMSLGTNGLPDSVDHLIQKDMPKGTFVLDISVFGGHMLEGYIYTNEDSPYQNTLQFYLIEGADGTIRHPDTGETLAPGNEGYAALALQLATEFSALDMADRVSLDEEQLTLFRKNMGHDEVDSALFAPVITTSAGDNWFAFEQANADRLDHFRELAPNTYGVEDTFGGGDGDFNDLVFQLIPIRMEELPVLTYYVNNTTAYLSPELFAGDASLGLLYQWIDTSADAVVVGSNFADFIVLQGTGNKAVNGAGGADVISGTGSVFLSGGGVGDADTFFLDGRAPGVSWSTIADFEFGRDKATIWGWREGVSRVLAVDDSGGAAGYTGLTLHFQNLLPDNAADADTHLNLNSITLTGKTLQDFGASSVDELNQQIASGSNSHFVLGQTNDQYGEHGYLFIS